MTVYDGRREHGRLRPTLRLRLTLLNGILLVGAAALLVLLAWLVVHQALRPSHLLAAGNQVVLADGQRLDARAWQHDLIDSAERELVIKGLVAVLAIAVVGVAGAQVNGRISRQAEDAPRELPAPDAAAAGMLDDAMPA